ncbi:MAG: hypothetical protein ACRD8A_13740 [Candidatus Acidiferrales bacterium]
MLPALFLLSCALPIEQYKTGADNHSWGNDNWQVVRSGSSVTLTAQATFKTPPGLVQIPVPLGDAMTIQHIRGTVSLSVPVAGVNGSIIAMLRDQDGNAIAAVKTQEFGDATATIPVDATLDCHLAVTSVQLEYYVDMPGTQIVSMSLEMN